jgi:hypothetical protein
MSFLFRTITGQVDQAFRGRLEANKFYTQIKFDLDQTAERAAIFEKVALVGLAGVLGLVVFSTTYSAAGREHLGKALSMAAVPLCILSYDCYQASENIRSEVMENPEGLMVIEDADGPVKINRVALRRCLLNKTLFFEPFLGIYIKACIKSTHLEM